MRLTDLHPVGPVELELRVQTPPVDSTFSHTTTSRPHRQRHHHSVPRLHREGILVLFARGTNLTVRLFWKLVRRFGSLVSNSLTRLKLDRASIGDLDLWWQIGGQLCPKMDESYKSPKYNTLKFSELRKKWANGELIVPERV
jgi:hypothetical protein